jgi:hypothetical protein
MVPFFFIGPGRDQGAQQKYNVLQRTKVFHTGRQDCNLMLLLTTKMVL